jgi:hypothetical protein
MKRLFTQMLLLLTGAFFLAGCQVASPITTTQDFLTQLQNDHWEQAAPLVVVSEGAHIRSLTDQEQQTWAAATKEALGAVTGFTVQNAIPLQEPQLGELGSGEGYEVFFELATTKAGSQHLKAVLVKVDDSWKLLDPKLIP